MHIVRGPWRTLIHPEVLRASTKPNKTRLSRMRGVRKTSGKGPREQGTIFDMRSTYPVGRPLTSRGCSLTTQLNLSIPAFTTSTLTEVASGQYFTLSSFSNYSLYTNLFDQYCVKRAEFWFVPAVSNATAEYGMYASVVDLDDANISGFTVQKAISKPGSVLSSIAAGQYHTFVPMMAVAAYAGAFTSYAAAQDNWVDCASPSIQYYGVKTCASSSLNAVVVNMRIRITVEFRGISNS